MARRAVVTGASSGIGQATVRELRRRGWDVVGVARREDRLRALADETGAEWFRADLTSADDVAALREFAASGPPVSALVNNAGGALGFATVEDGDPEDWRRMFDINVLSVQRVTSALLPLLREGAKEAGVADVLTVTSIAGHVVRGGQVRAEPLGSRLLGERPQPVLAAGDPDHVPAAAAQLPHRRRTDSRARPRDHRASCHAVLPFRGARSGRTLQR